jgi:hypothetical protein
MRGDKEDDHGAEGTMTREMLLTDPDQATDFVKATQLDAPAIAIGTSHGTYKFSRKPTGDISGDRPDQGNPSADSQHASRDAWHLVGAPGSCWRNSVNSAAT